MLLWFAGGSFVAVWVVFRSPALDYRLVMAGAVLPVAEAVLGGPRLLHTLLACALGLGLVMMATRERRLLRRRWLGLPIGMFLHLVLDGTWTRSGVFWWPFLGADFGAGQIPELERGLPVVALLEAAGIVALAWCWRRFGLADAGRRRTFLSTGRLDRSLAAEA
ncbi:hypothetical protein BH24ACT3_BH24ACT3_17310 [soil metagenome]